MLIKDHLSKVLVTCKPETSIQEVAKLMKNHEVGAVLVTVHRRPVGILTDRDLVVRFLAENRQLLSVTAEDVMSRAVETVSDQGDLSEVIRTMQRASVRRIPVVNTLGEAVGLLSFDDMLDLVADEVAALRDVVRPREPKFLQVAV